MSFIEALASATCAVFVPPTDGRGASSLNVEIPEIATDGVLLVQKTDPNYAVRFIDPEGNELSSASATISGQRYERTGQGTATETLRIVDPLPGAWKVELDGTGDSLSTASAVWQGAVTVALDVNPANPKPGTDSVVEAYLATRRGPVSSEGLARQGAEFSAQLVGDFGKINIELNDLGVDPDRFAKDGRFSGVYTLPSNCVTSAAVSVSVSVRGTQGDVRNANLFCGSDAVGIPQASLELKRSYRVQKGQTIAGKIRVSGAEEALKIRVSVDSPTPDFTYTLENGVIDVTPGADSYVFRVRVAESAKIGTFRLRVSASIDGKTIASQSPEVEVFKAPLIPDRLKKLLLFALILFCAGVWIFVLRRRAENERRNLKGWVVALHDGTLSPARSTFRESKTTELIDLEVTEHGVARRIGPLRAGSSAVKIASSADRGPILTIDDLEVPLQLGIPFSLGLNPEVFLSVTPPRSRAVSKAGGGQANPKILEERLKLEKLSIEEEW